MSTATPPKDVELDVELDLEFVRKQFPAFSEPDLRGQAFFENAGWVVCLRAGHRPTDALLPQNQGAALLSLPSI